MKLDEWPPDIEDIFQKPGLRWTDKEHKKVIESLFGKERLWKLLTITRQHLGPPPPSPEDTEDAFYDLCNRLSKFSYLDKLINKYDPQKGRFLTYFIEALKNFIHKRGAKIRERLGREVFLVSKQHNREVGLDKDSESIELILPDHNLNSQPDLLSEYEEVIDCINQLPTNEGKVFIAYYFKPYGCDLRLMSVDTADGLVNEGRNLVIVALVGTNLYIRIFDANGERAVDKAENQLTSGETLTTLKKQLNPLPNESGLSPEQKQKIIRDATSIAGHTQPYSYADIATEMKITEANARQLCHRARVQVTKCLEQNF